MTDPARILVTFCKSEMQKWKVAASGARRMAAKELTNARYCVWWAEYCERRAEECRDFLDALRGQDSGKPPAQFAPSHADPNTKNTGLRNKLTTERNL